MAQGFTGAGISGSGAANRVAFWSAPFVLSSDSAFTYNSGSQVLTAPNLVVTTAATFSARTATRIAYFGVAGVLSDSAALAFDGTDVLTLGGSAIQGVSGNIGILGTANKTLTFLFTDNRALTIPATGTAALLNIANVFTLNQTISNTAPSLILTDTTAAAKSLTIAVDANIADLRESAGASGSLLALDLANNRVGIGMNNPTVALDVTGAAKVSSTLTVGSSVITGTSGNLTIAVTAGKTLSLAAADNYTLTVPATGTVPLGTGTNTHVAYWSGTNDLTGSSSFTFSGSQVKIGSGSDAAGVTAQLYVTLNGTTNLSIRDSTNDVELLNFVSSAGGVIGTFTNHSLAIRTNNTLGISIDTSQNVGITTSTFGTSAAGVLAVFNRTAPTTGPADTVQFYSSDDSAGNTVPSFYCEGTGVVATGQADSASSVRVKMRINGTVRTFLCI